DHDADERADRGADDDADRGARPQGAPGLAVDLPPVRRDGRTGHLDVVRLDAVALQGRLRRTDLGARREPRDGVASQAGDVLDAQRLLHLRSGHALAAPAGADRKRGGRPATTLSRAPGFATAGPGTG